MQPPELIYGQEEDGSLRFKGDPASVQLSEVVERVKGVLGEEWEKASTIREEMGEPYPSLTQVRLALIQLAQSGDIERDPPITEGDANGRTMRWCKRTKPNPTP